MRYIKENRAGLSITKTCILLFQICVVTDAVIGLEPKLYVISKGCMLAFFVIMTVNLLWNGRICFGHSLIFPVLFMVINAISVLWAEYPDATIYRLTTQVQFYILFFFSYALYSNEEIDLKKYFDAIYLAGIGMALFALYRYGWMGIIKGLNEGKRLGGEITNENVFGMVFSKAAIVAFYYYLRSRKNPIHFLHISLVIVFTLFAFSSGSKKAFLMILAGVLCVNVFENGISKMWKTILISIFVVAGIGILVQMPVFSTMNQRIMTFLSGGKDSGDVVRSKMISESMRLFYEKPIFGHGFNNFGIITGFGAYSHNNLTELLVSTGLVGFIFFYIPYALVIRWGWITGIRNKNYTAKLLLILSIIYLVFGYAMVEYYDKDYWMFLGVMVASVDNDRVERIGERINASLQTVSF